MTDETLDQLRRAKAGFQTAFNTTATHAGVAPGRVNLIGEHTDYNDGYVLPMAIEMQTIVLASADDATGPLAVQLCSAAMREPVTFVVDEHLKPGEPTWANYVRGVLAGCLHRNLLPKAGRINLYVDSTVPLGGGLSSSAALEVATATAMESLVGRSIPPVEKALLCQTAEHDFAGMPCGIMDQFISTLAQADHAMLLDCRTQQPTMLPLTDPDVTVLITNTNVKHELTGGEYAQRRRQCETAAQALGVPALRDAKPSDLKRLKSLVDSTAVARARHAVSEDERTLQAATAIRNGDWQTFGELMFASHASLRDDFEVSCAELDVLVELARELVATGEVFGSRMTGGGFGGCTVSLVRTADVARVSRHLFEGYKTATGREATIFSTRPGAGSRVLSV